MAFSFTSELKQSWLWLTLACALIALLLLLGPILTPFIAAAILAYALNPGVDWLTSRRIGRFRMPRSLAVVAVMTFLFLAILAIVLIVLPVLQKEIPLLQEKIPVFMRKLNAMVGTKLHDAGLNIRLDSAGIRKLLSEHFGAGDDVWGTVLISAKAGGIAVLGWFITILLTPVALFYLLLDWHMLVQKVENSIPRRWLGKALTLAKEVDQLLAHYLRGQLLVMLVLSAYYSIGLAVAGFDVALPVGFITGFLVFIPYLGYGLGLVLALIAAILQFDGFQGLIAVAVIYSIGQVVEGFFLTPRLVGERIGLHPLVVIFALLAFGKLFGFVGVLLALPASAIISVACRHLRNHYLNSSFYQS